MYQLPADLAAQHATVLAALPLPLPPAGVRTLRNASARDHRTAEIQRKAGRAQNSRHCLSRSDRLSRSAALVQARAADLAALVR